MGAFKFAKTVMKSLFNKPATLMYPVVEREWQERTRGAIGIDSETCILCGICARKCPTGAIAVDRKSGTWEIQRMQCIQCGYCVSECPKGSLVMEQKYTEPQVEKVVDVVDIQSKKPEKSEVEAAPDANLTCNKDACVFCGLCAKACPADALKVDRKEKIWEVDDELCAKCGVCVEKCPKKCLSFGERKADEEEQSAEQESVTKPESEHEADKASERESDGKSEAAPVSVEDSGKSEDDACEVAEETLACNKGECIFCGLCAKVCPVEALKVDRKEKIWEVDDELCVKCEACVDKCPKSCLSFGDAFREVAEDDKTSESTKSNEKAKSAEEDNETGVSCETEAADEKLLPKLDEGKCIYCRACENECPQEAISAEVDEWTLDEDKCIGCGACTEVCPADALKM